ncbi:MAG: DMT family transporter [Alphaproteobacteria bacterium]
MPVLLLLLATLSWGGNFPVAKWLSSGSGQSTFLALGPVELAMWRWTLAAVIVLLFFRKGVREMFSALAEHWKIMFVLAFLSVSTFNTLIYIGLQSTTAINAALLNIMLPIFIMLMGALIYRDKIGSSHIISIALGFIGLVLIVCQGDINRLLGLKFVHGDLIVTLAMLFYAFYSVTLRKRPPISATALLSGCILLGLPVLVLAAAFTGINTTPFSWSGQTWLGMAYLAVFPSLVAILCWNTGVQMIGAVKASLFILTAPIFGGLFSVLLLGEALKAYHFAALGFVAFAIWLSYRKQSTAKT